MTPPYKRGDFVWCNYPQHENSVAPGPRHVGYVAIATEGSIRGSDYAAILAYTSSQTWSGPTPPGVRRFSRDEAQTVGQQRPFHIDLRRSAFVPITAEWFPRLNEADRGVIGRAPQKLVKELEATLRRIYEHSPQNIERLGPLWPRRR